MSFAYTTLRAKGQYVRDGPWRPGRAGDGVHHDLPTAVVVDVSCECQPPPSQRCGDVFDGQQDARCFGATGGQSTLGRSSSSSSAPGRDGGPPGATPLPRPTDRVADQGAS